MAAVIRKHDNDVLLGRGGRNHEHDGNEQLRRIAHSRVREYEAATKKQKAGISRQILHQIQNLEPPGRFLQKNYSTYEWQEVSHAVAREKVCQALRDSVAIEKDKRSDVPSNPLPDVLDVLSSEQLVTAPISKKIKIQAAIVTPVKHEAEDDYEDGADRYRNGISDDFDLFDGELLRATEDEVLDNAVVKEV